MKLYRLCEVCCLYGCFVYHILVYSFGSILYHFIYSCMFRFLLFNIADYVFFILMYSYCYVYVCSILGILFFYVVRVLFLCECVLYYCHRVPTQLQLTNVSYYTISLLLQDLTTSVYLGRRNSLHTSLSILILFSHLYVCVCVCHQSGIPLFLFIPCIVLSSLFVNHRTINTRTSTSRQSDYRWITHTPKGTPQLPKTDWH
jgi:hypothetical protein